MGAAFLTNLKIAINEVFSCRMARISKGEGCQKWGLKYNGEKTSLPTVKFALNYPNVFLINLINSLTFAYLRGLKNSFFQEF